MKISKIDPKVKTIILAYRYIFIYRLYLIFVSIRNSEYLNPDVNAI